MGQEIGFSAAESLNGCLKSLLEQYYGKTKDTFQLCLCQTSDGEEDHSGEKWECLSGEEDNAGSLVKMLSEGSDSGSLKGRKLEWKWPFVLCDDARADVRDSRIPINGKKPRSIRLIFLGEKNSVSIQLITSILSRELMAKLDDMLLLEHVGEKLNSGVQTTPEDLRADALCKFFLGELLDKDWLTQEYVKQALLTEGLPDWSVFTQMSALSYEKRPVRTKMYFTDQENGDDACIFRLDDAHCMNLLDDPSFRTVRKLMEAAGPECGLLIRKPDYRIEGMATSSKEMNSLTCVEFLGHMAWNLQKGGEILFEYRQGKYWLPELESGDDTQEEIGKLEKTCGRSAAALVNSVKDLATHGTSLIFMDSDTLEEETKRLAECHRAIRVNAFNLLTSLKQVKDVFSIDGAVMLDSNCNCRAIGAIVDGEAMESIGNAARGARYNSVASYVHGIKHRYTENSVTCCAAIISEDGMVSVEMPNDDGDAARR